MDDDRDHETTIEHEQFCVQEKYRCRGRFVNSHDRNKSQSICMQFTTIRKSITENSVGDAKNDPKSTRKENNKIENKENNFGKKVLEGKIVEENNEKPKEKLNTIS